MLVGGPHLSIRSPTSTTIEYTVTTLPRPTLAIRILLPLVALLRISLGLSLLLLLFSKLQASDFAFTLPTYTNGAPPFSLEETPLYLLAVLHTSPLGVAFTAAAQRIQCLWLAVLAPVLTHVLLTPLHTTESLLILRGLGIQTSSSPRSYLSYLGQLGAYITGGGGGGGSGIEGISVGGAGTRFIPTEQIQDFYVNEVFRGFEVRYMLCVVVRDEEELVVVFERLMPGRKICEAVWRGGREALWGEREKWGGKDAVVGGSREGKDGKKAFNEEGA